MLWFQLSLQDFNLMVNYFKIKEQIEDVKKLELKLILTPINLTKF